MTFADWQSLSPALAARRIAERLATLPAAQQRAAVAWRPPEAKLAAAFESADAQAPLARVPYFLKDLFDVAGLPTAAGSTFLPEVRPTPSTDSVMARRLCEKGAVLAGKSQLHEFAFGMTGENPHFGDCEHPRFPGHTTGGSSSGSAALVAAGVVPFAVGSDTGCSVRLPAAFCGLFGFRLATQNDWIRDAVPLAQTFDAAGLLTSNAADLQLLLSTLMGRRTSQRHPRGAFLEWPNLDPDIARTYREAASKFAQPADKATQSDLLRGFASSSSAYGVITGHEASQNHQAWFVHHRERYDPAVRARLEAGAALTQEQIESAQVTLAAVRLLWTQVFLSHDFLILPAAPCATLTKAECTLVNRQRILACNTPASLGGLPVLTVPFDLPSGKTGGLQIVVNHEQSPVIDWVLRQQ